MKALPKKSTANQRKKHNVEKYIQWVTTQSLTIRSIFMHIAVVASQTCEIPQISEGIQANSSSRSSKVIDLGVNRNRICDFLLVINSNFGSISYRFQDIDV